MATDVKIPTWATPSEAVRVRDSVATIDSAGAPDKQERPAKAEYNAGILGSMRSTPILNAPQTRMLAMHSNELLEDPMRFVLDT